MVRAAWLRKEKDILPLKNLLVGDLLVVQELGCVLPMEGPGFNHSQELNATCLN